MNPFETFGAWLSIAVGWVLDLVLAIGPVWGTVIAGVGIFLETSLFVGLVVPGDTIVLTAATAVRDPLHFAVLWTAVVVGTLAGQSIGFLLGRWAGPAIRRSALGRKLGEANWDRAARFVDRRGGIAVFVSRFLPVLHALMPVTVGMSRMSYRRFISWATPAALIWASAYVAAGTFAGVVFRELLLSGLHWAGYVFAAAILVFLVIVWLVKRRLRRDEEAVLAEPDTAAEAAERLTTSTDSAPEGGRIERDVRDDESV